MKTTCLVFFVAMALITTVALAQTDTTFTYQGELNENGNPANGSFNFDVSLWDALAGGNQIGLTDVHNGVPVVEGRFAVELDFGASAFDNSDRWLEIDVNGVTLAPRTPITRAPYAIQTRGIFVDGNYDVGIGTVLPDDILHVHGDAAALRLQDDNDPNSYTILRDASPTQAQLQKFIASGGVIFDIDPIPLDGSSDAQLRLFRSTNTTGLKRVTFYRGNNTTQTSALIGLDGADSYFQIQGGNVGIGTPAPEGMLHLRKQTTTADLPERLLVVDSHDDPNSFDLQSGSGSGILFKVPYQSDSQVGAAIDAVRTTNVEFDSSTALAFSVTQNNENLFEAMRIHSTGNVSIGTSTDAAKLTVEYFGNGPAITGRAIFPGATSIVGNTFDGVGLMGHASATSGVNYAVYGRSDSSSGYDFYAAGAGINYGAPSSIRWKRNIEPVKDPLGMLSRLRGVYYDWDEEHGGGHDLGMIGEEVGKVLPEIVAYEKDGKFVTGMDYSRLTPLLVEAVKRLRDEKDLDVMAIWEVQEQALAQKDAEISKLVNRVSELELLVRKLAASTSLEIEQ